MTVIDIIKDNETDLMLKDYLKKMTDFVGEEYTIISITQEENIKDSVSRFTSKFDSSTNNELAVAFVKSSILAPKKENRASIITKTLLKERKYADLIFLVNYNLGYRRELTKDFIEQSDSTYEELFSKIENKEEIMKQLVGLKAYETALNKHFFDRITK